MVELSGNTGVYGSKKELVEPLVLDRMLTHGTDKQAGMWEISANITR